MRNLLLIALFSFSAFASEPNVAKVEKSINIFEIIGLERSGCCSSHGGVAYCGYTGSYVCQDGWTSSCRCN